MREFDGNILFSATDLMRFMGCSHATRLDLLRMRGEGPEPSEDTEDAALLQKQGDAHEAAHLEKLKASGRGVIEIERGDLARNSDETRAALATGADIVFQGAFLSGNWGGWSDFLERVESRSALGPFSYEVADTKLKRRPHPIDTKSPPLECCGSTDTQAPSMIDFYDTNAEQFLNDTRHVDMSALRERFIAELPQDAADTVRILDAGTGSGRDARAFHRAGYQVAAFDASPTMVKASADFAGLPVQQMRFEDFSWDHSFEGIWACASLLHLARKDLPFVMRRLADHMVTDGILYASFKLGSGDRQKDGRLFTDMTEESLSALLDESPALRQVEIWRTNDRRPDKKEDIWLNALLRKS
ncbi:methyltransferase domain-containing protein [Aestuariicoccus sp. MJ-SS9]|uniref:methyltransferase domain-containing protein n=1 Tax=Aestuariicoccus sp. MJ-SS9 TaxID=3079855 RepID=UPI002930E6BA|nr:methyltransferase domain-containing protein [Aestuariicoccus sp. MJ-SS9]